MSCILDYIVVKITHKSRMVVYGILLAYYIAQLVVFLKHRHSKTGADDIIRSDAHLSHAVEGVNIFLLLVTMISLILGWIRPTYLERLTVFINSILFSLTVGWLVLCIEDARFVIAYYMCNSLFALWFICMDVFSQLYVRKTTSLLNDPQQSPRNRSNTTDSQRDSEDDKSVATQPKLKLPMQNKTVRTNTLFRSKHKFQSLKDDHNTSQESMSHQQHDHTSPMRNNLLSNSNSNQQSVVSRVMDSESDLTGEVISDSSGLMSDGGSQSAIKVLSKAKRSVSSSGNSNALSRSKSPTTPQPRMPMNNPAGGGNSNNTSTSSQATQNSVPSGPLFDGIRANMHHFPIPLEQSIPRDLTFEAFESIEHRLDSSSCHIYTAYWVDANMYVIIKQIKADRLSSTVAIQEFEAEENVLLRVRHNNIVRLLGSGNTPRKFLVLELLSGGSLAHSLGVRPDSNKQIWAKKYSLLETLEIAYDLAKALHYLHSQYDNRMHIVHRDLKPDNIGFTADGTVKLFDFGLCATIKAQREKTEQYKLTGNTGTLRYMAPEVVLGRSYNQSVDVYSFGVLIWQIATGKVPYNNMGKKQYYDTVVMGGARLRMEKMWPNDFKQLLSVCWHEDKNQRPDFGTVLRELESIIAHQQRLEAMKTNYFNRRCLTCTKQALIKLKLLFLVLFVLMFLYAITIVIVDENFVDGASFIIVASFFIYGICLSYFNVWPYVVIHKSQTGNVISGLEISNLDPHGMVHNNNNKNNNNKPPGQSPVPTPGGPVGSAKQTSSATSTNHNAKVAVNRHGNNNNNSKSTTISATVAGVADADGDGVSLGDIEMNGIARIGSSVGSGGSGDGYSFNPIVNVGGKVAQRSTVN